MIKRLIQRLIQSLNPQQHKYKLLATNGEQFIYTGSYKQVTKIGKEYLQSRPFVEIRIYKIEE